jgi:hypothetical protein
LKTTKIWKRISTVAGFENGLYSVVKIDLTPRRNEMVTITDRVVTNRDESTSMRTTAPLLVLAMCCWLASFETTPHSE